MSGQILTCQEARHEGGESGAILQEAPPRIDRHPITEKEWREEINSLELTNLVD
jgi:hypothetical protein